MPQDLSTHALRVEPLEERLAGPSMHLPVVAVGAAAGGLAATSELLRHLGSQPGVAIVLVHHFDATTERGLAELVQKTTTLPVRLVTDGMRLKANQIHVGPQEAIVGLDGGVLRLAPCTVTAGHHHPIDRLFESLAADRTVQPLGVVLTGMGSDGTAGIQAIKINGGITFAQDGSAEYRGMPESAIATGCVDFIRAPEEIAREVLRIAGRELAPAPPDADGDEEALLRILTALRGASAIDFGNYKRATLRRRVERRAIVRGADDLTAYAELVERSPEEARALCEEVLIHVTSFFRDPETFEALGAIVFPKLLEHRPRNAALRIWVPGCATGEEVYSLAIALLEFLGDTQADGPPIQLFGTDVSAAAIDKARAGRYPDSISRDVSDGRLQRFFTDRDGFHQIRREVRDLCVFGKQDATRDPPFAGMDLISCRNLMVHLGRPLQDRLVPALHHALREPGFLVLGNLETMRPFPGFTPVDAKNRIFARTSAAPRKPLDFGDRRRLEASRPEGLAGTEPSLPQDVNREVDRLVLAELAPPGVVVTEDLAIVQFRGRTGPFLEPAAGVASFDLMRMVRRELRLPLRQIIDEARTRQTAARREVPLSGPGPSAVLLGVIPLRLPWTTQRFFVVLFGDADAPPVVAGAPHSVNTQLAEELASTRDYVQSVIEQLETSNEELRAANEEIASNNEELISTNDELLTAKQELQATNEQLGTTNHEMEVRNREATRLNEDLTNVLTSVSFPIVLLGRDSRLRRFTPAAARLFGLDAGDVGRPFGEVDAIFSPSALGPSIAQVLQELTPVERTVQDQRGRWFQVKVLPYVTLDKRIDGTVVVAVDIDAMKKGELLLRDYRDKLRQTAHDAVLAEERERRRIAVEVHDHIGQALALAQIKLTSIRETVQGQSRAAFDQALELLVQSIADTRTLIFDLSPPVLYDLGLKEALSWLAEDFEKRHGLAIDLADDGVDKALSDATAALVFRVVREILINVAKHARSPSARVALGRADGHYRIEVEDRGIGFDPKQIERGRAHSGFGLFSVREQIERLGGAVDIESSPGRGTRVSLRVPILDQYPSPDGSLP